MTSLFKKLSIALVAGLIAAIATVVPANAATLVNASVAATGAIGTSSTNAYPVTLTATTVSNSQFVKITLPTGWSANFMGGQTCPSISVTGFSITGNGCQSGGGSTVTAYGNANIPGGTTISVTFIVGALNVAAARDFGIETTLSGGGSVDTATVTLSSTPASSTVTFNANNGSGAMANQSASTATALSTNAFTRSGYTFAGWNTAADGSGTAYADGASYAFTSSTTLYAQWTATLATTGFDGKPYLYTAFALAITGAAVMLLSSRRKQNI